MRTGFTTINGRRAGTLGAAAIAALVFAAAPVFTQSMAPAKTPVVSKQHKVAPGLYELAASESTGMLYVASAGARDGAPPTIFGLDNKTLETKSKIDVASAAAYGLAINDKTQMLYTSNTRAGSVSAIDIKTGRIVATIKDPADAQAHVFRVLVDEEANTVYVSIASTPGQVWIIDGKTSTLAGIIKDVGTRTTGLALDKAANRLYVSSLGSNDISVIDLATKQVTSRLPAGGERPTQLAFDPKTNKLFVTNQGTGDLGIVDTKTGQLLKTVKTGAGALGVGFNAITNLVYVANRGAGTITVVDPTTFAVVTDLQAGTLPNTVAIDRKTGDVFVTNKARTAGRGARAGGPPAPGAAPGTAAPNAAASGAPGAAAPAPGAPAAPPADEAGDTVTLIHR